MTDSKVERDMKMILVVRKDLNMRKGKIAAQASHAAVGAILENLDHESVKEWLAGHFKKICVYVNSQEELFEVLDHARTKGLITKLILDAGHTEFNQPTYTCCSIGPAEAGELESVTGKLPLL